MELRGAPPNVLGRVRRDVERALLRSRNGLRLISGVARPAIGVSPKDVVWRSGKVELWRYRGGDRSRTPPLLLVHSLVSKSFILDLAPGNSFIEHLVGHGFDVYLADWGEPDAVESGNTLETYCDDLLPSLVDQVRSTSGTPTVNMFGYCLGGLLAVLYAAGHSQGPLESLAVMATPIDFSVLGTMTSIIRDDGISAEHMLDVNGNVPAEVMLNTFRMLQPTGDISNYANLWQHMWNDEYVEAHQRMNSWAKDHIPFPGACMMQLAELFARENLLMKGHVPLGDRTVDLEDITMPFVNIFGEKDNIVPPESSAALTHLVGSSDREELRLNAGHAGLIVGKAAQTRNIPAMVTWLEQHSELM